MITSPFDIPGSSAAMVSSTGLPAGTMIHTTRGALSFAVTSRQLTYRACGAECDVFLRSRRRLRSKTTTSWPPFIRRSDMLPPIRPRPIIAKRIASCSG